MELLGDPLREPLRHVFGSLLVLLAATSAAGCSSGPEVDLYCAPPDFGGFPHFGSEDIICVEAQLDPNHASDLLEQGIVPDKLTIQLLGKGAGERPILLEPDRWDMRLYLSDGTVVSAVNWDKVAPKLDEDIASKIQRRTFPTLIGTQPSEGNLFFALDLKHFQIDGRAAHHIDKQLSRPLNLVDSLLAFNATDGDTVVPCYVGIRP